MVFVSRKKPQKVNDSSFSGLVTLGQLSIDIEAGVSKPGETSEEKGSCAQPLQFML